MRHPVVLFEFSLPLVFDILEIFHELVNHFFLHEDFIHRHKLGEMHDFRNKFSENVKIVSIKGEYRPDDQIE
jgi:hypothetical protein